MGILDFLKKNDNPIIEKKSDNPAKCSTGGIDFLFNTYGYEITFNYISPLLAYKFYHTISPLQGSIKKISSAVSELPLVLRNKTKADEIIKKHPVLDLLNTPSPDKTKKQFFSGISNSSLLTREIWIIARGRVNSEPVSLEFAYPYEIDVGNYSTGEWPEKVTLERGGKVYHYYRELIKNRFRYFDKLKMNEIFPYIIDRGDTTGYDGTRGISQLTSLKDELLSYKASIIGNKSSIENSGRPSGIISPEDEELDEDQYDELEKSMAEMEGALNSGKIILLPNKVKALFPQWTPKEMDYEQLQANVKSNIWRLFSIPAPIVSETGQTYSNFSEAQPAFYDEAVNQAWDPISDGLEWSLITRFPDLNNWRISYDELEVPALKARATKRMKDLTESKALTTNEVRRSSGREAVSNGDHIVVPANSTTLDAVVDGAGFGLETPPVQE